jgi:hypothetical protein
MDAKIPIGTHQCGYHFVIHSAAVDRMGMAEDYQPLPGCKLAIYIPLV